jgi:hypothetical protein
MRFRTGAHSAVVNRPPAQKFGSVETAVGQTFGFTLSGQEPCFTIVGVRFGFSGTDRVVWRDLPLRHDSDAGTEYPDGVRRAAALRCPVRFVPMPLLTSAGIVIRIGAAIATGLFLTAFRRPRHRHQHLM